MRPFFSAFWAESLKVRRSKVTLLTAIAFSALPFIAGLFMFILKDPERARSMGLISVKAQMTAGVADWPTYFQVLLLGTGIAGAILFAFITAWVFGREFSDHTIKELLALPTSRGVIVSAKFVTVIIWILSLTLLLFAIGLGIGKALDMPGWSLELEASSFWSLMIIALLSTMLTPFVTFFASVGRGYLLPLGWAFLTMALAQIALILGWGDWFPWAVPGLLASISGPRPEPIELHSYVIVFLASLAGIAATLAWWQNADQTR
jgi:ABC-2 type transport system permease protein